MKKLLPLFILVFAFSQSIFAAPLVFKVTKELLKSDVTEIASFDASKYKQIRIAIKAIDREKIKTKELARIDLDYAKNKFAAVEGVYKAGATTRLAFDVATNELKEAQAAYDNSVIGTDKAGIFGIEEGTDILLETFTGDLRGSSFVIDTPPSKISIRVFGKGTYKVYVWAT